MSGRERWFWLLQVISGVLLLFLVGLHMIAQHFVVEGGLRTYEAVVAYLSHPVVWILEALLLLVVTFHAVLGVRAVVLDLNPSPRTFRWVQGALAALGFLAVIYGLWLLFLIRG